MKVGKGASLVLVLLLTALAGGAAFGVLISGQFPTLTTVPRMSLFCGLVGLAFAIVLMPFGMLLDGSLRRFADHIQQIADSDQPTPGNFAGPKWLRPVTRAFTDAISTMARRERDLRNQIQQGEIHNRVVEAERRQLEGVLHALQDAVIVTDAFHDIVMVNEAAANLLGFQVPDAVHHPIDNVIKDSRLTQLIRNTRETANFADRRIVEHDITTTDDSGARTERVFEVTLGCIENHKSEVGGVVTILRDLTHEREISQMKSDFVSKASHELRTPLSSIRAYMEMLIDGEADTEDSRQEFYGIIQNETDRLGRLIDNMLNISRIEAGIIQIDREIVDLKPLIDRAIETLDPQAAAKSIALHTKIAPVDLKVEGDADMLFQVILNLASNAVKYTPEGGRVTLGADSDNLTRSIVVTISDTGLGIPPDSLPKLFDKFYRVENYKRVAKGTGLGLNLCKHIVETVHKGQIGVESKLGMGSKFWFSVPMRYIGSQQAA